MLKIFVTLGTQKFQMNRLLVRIDEIAKEHSEYEFFAQTGGSDYKPQYFEYKNFLQRDEFDQKMKEADLLITHGGAGSITSGLNYGKKVIAIARDPNLGEHVDDHQTQLIGAFALQNYLLYCEDLENLDLAITKALHQDFAPYHAESERLFDSIVDDIEDLYTAPRMSKNQFAYMKEPVDKEGYTSVRFTNGWYLSYDQGLSVVCDPVNNRALIGYAWSILPGETSPQFDVTNRELKDIKAKSDYWCGRYVLIDGVNVYTDAAACLGVFYSNKGAASDIRLLIDDESKIPSWKPNKVMNWFPAPLTPYPGIKRLMPSQRYNVAFGRTDFIGLRADVERLLDGHNKVEVFCNLFVASLQNMKALFHDKQITLALTGGFDSRSVLALCKRAGLNVFCFTLEHDLMSSSDKTVPAQLAKICGYPFKYYPRYKFNDAEDRDEDYLSFISYMEDEEDRLFYDHHQYEQLRHDYNKDIVILRGSLWEIAKEYEAKYHKADDFSDVYDRYELRKSSPAYKSFEEYFAYTKQNPEENMSKAARFYWEQRACGWGAENEHGFDLYDGIISVSPLNSRILISLLLQFTSQEQKNKSSQRAIIKYAYQDLLLLDFNADEKKPAAKIKEAGRKIKKLLRRLHTIGIRRTLRFYQRFFRG